MSLLTFGKKWTQFGVPFKLALPEAWKQRGWQAKIREREGPEVPHVTLLLGTRAWRFDLREWRCLDKEPPEKDVPDALRSHVREQLSVLVEEWDAMYPHNKVQSAPEERAEKPGRRKK